MVEFGKPSSFGIRTAISDSCTVDGDCCVPVGTRRYVPRPLGRGAGVPLRSPVPPRHMPWRAPEGEAGVRVRGRRRGRQDHRLGGARGSGWRCAARRWWSSASIRPSDLRARWACASFRASRTGSSRTRSPSTACRQSGELWAMMLDSKRTFDDLIARLAPDERARDEVLSNRIYRELSSAVAGSQEFTAVAKLFELHRDAMLGRDRARHPSLARCARLPRRARPPDAIPGGSRTEGVALAWRRHARPARAWCGLDVRGVCPRHRRQPARRAIGILRLARRRSPTAFASVHEASSSCCAIRTRAF